MKRKTIRKLIVCTAVAAGAVGASAVDVDVKVTRISVEDNIYTPYYPRVQTVLGNQQGAGREWLQLHVEYTTTGGWIDELRIEQFALVTDTELGKPVILNEDVTYINIKPGDHYANIYMHPNLIDRYGVDSYEVDTAAIFRIGDKIVARSETTKHAVKGWSGNADVLEPRGHLLNHAETPFWFINYDFKEIIKREAHAHGE